MQRQKYKRTKRKTSLIVMLVLAILVSLVLLAFLLVHHKLQSYYKLTNYVENETLPAPAGQGEGQEAAEAVFSLPAEEETGLTASEAEALQTEMREGTEAAAVPAENTDEGRIINLLLVGVDRREDNWNGNSDAMVLVSVNSKTRRIHMISFMRDLYADIEGWGVYKLNTACAIGGCPLLVDTIEKNYRIDIDYYAWVDFQSMADIIDALGGVELPITEKELPYVNGYAWDMCNIRGLNSDEHQLAEAGESVLCDGIEAVAYARIRYVGNSDYERTERQRRVLVALKNKMASMSILKLDGFLKDVLPLVTHNVPSGQVMTMAASLPSYLSYELVQSRVPYDGLYTSRHEMLIPEMAETIERLHSEIYGGEGTQVHS